MKSHSNLQQVNAEIIENGQVLPERDFQIAMSDWLSSCFNSITEGTWLI